MKFSPTSLLRVSQNGENALHTCLVGWDPEWGASAGWLGGRCSLKPDCPRLSTHYPRLPQRPQAEGPEDTVSFRKPPAVPELWVLTILRLVWRSLADEPSWLLTGQLSPTNCGGARKLATSEKVGENGNTYRYVLFRAPWVTGGHKWSGQVDNGPALCYRNYTKQWYLLALFVASCCGELKSF